MWSSGGAQAGAHHIAEFFQQERWRVARSGGGGGGGYDSAINLGQTSSEEDEEDGEDDGGWDRRAAGGQLDLSARSWLTAAIPVDSPCCSCNPNGQSMLQLHSLWTVHVLQL